VIFAIFTKVHRVFYHFFAVIFYCPYTYQKLMPVKWSRFVAPVSGAFAVGLRKYLSVYVRFTMCMCVIMSVCRHLDEVPRARSSSL